METKLECLKEFKSIISIIYDVQDIREISGCNSDIAFIEIIDSKDNKTTLQVKLDGLSYKEIDCKCIETLPLSNNILMIEEDIEAKEDIIKILDKDTFKCLESHSIKLSDSYINLLKRGFKNDFVYCEITKDYTSIAIPFASDRYNIHGDILNINNAYRKLSTNKFISERESKIICYDNMEDMREINTIKLNTFGDNLYYFPIVDNKDSRTQKEQVIFLYFNKSSNLYAYSLKDEKIHLVRDNRVKIEINKFIYKLEECLNTTDEERIEKYNSTLDNFNQSIKQQKDYEIAQFNLDVRSIESHSKNLLDIFKTVKNSGTFISICSIQACIRNYQNEFNGDYDSRWRKNVTIPNDDSNFEYTEAEKIVSLSTTPYRIKVNNLLNEYRLKQMTRNCSILTISKRTISKNRLIKKEGIQINDSSK